MAYPKVTFFQNDPERLANYLCYLGKQIACGYYQDRRFLVLPRLLEKNARSVFFPDFAYPSSIWEGLKKFDRDVYIWNFSPEITGLVKKFLDNEAYRCSIEKDWKRTEKEFFTCLSEFFPHMRLDKIKEINVTVSPWGTTGSFFFQKDKVGNYTFEMTNRTDMGPAEIAEKIISLLIHIEKPNTPIATWFQQEALVDYLLEHSKLGQIFDFNYCPTVGFDTVELPSNLVSESEAYLTKLGFPIKSIFDADFKNYTISINGEPMPRHFTPSERRILAGLIQNKNKLISYDQIGNMFWGEEASLEKFSLQSIAKIMEKIRKKIKDAGVYQELIYTVRGQGYVLYD